LFDSREGKKQIGSQAKGFESTILFIRH